MIVVNFILKLLNWLVLGGLALALLAPQINPSLFWPPAFFGLLLPIFWVLNVLFLVYWAIRAKLRFVFNLALLVLSLGSINKIITFGAKASPERDGKLKVISYNTKLFGIYDQGSFNKEFIEEIAHKNPDILCLQEFFNIPTGTGNTLDELKKKTGLKYGYFRSLRNKKRQSKFGIIILSRYKIIDYGEVDFGKQTLNLCIYVDVKIKNKVTRIYNAHLQSLSLNRTDYSMLKSVGESMDTTMQVSKNIFKRIKTAYIQRGEQAVMLKESMQSCGKPTILCGDFNDPPQSFSYAVLSKNMKDCFIESGNGLGGTYIGPLPSLRIDYILHDTSMVSFNYQAEKMFTSDHKMVEALIDNE